MANTISVNVIADVRNIRHGIDGVNRQLSGFQKTSSKIGGVFKGALVGAAGYFAADKVIGFFKDSIAEGRESNKVMAQTRAVLKSTGGEAGLTAKQIGNLSTSLSNKTGIDDEVIQSGANLLLTFTNIRNEAGKGNDIFNQTVAVANDMSVALGQDMKSSSIQLGKALNDPIKGITALRRVGVSFTDQQQKQIKTLVESGHTLTAQKLILKEVNKEFGGSAAATTTPMQKLQVVLNNLKEQLGQALIPIIDKFATYLAKNLPGAIDYLTPKIKTFASIMGSVFNFIKNNRTTLTVLAGTILSVAAGIRIGVAAFKAYKAIAQAVRVVQFALNVVMLANPIGLVVVAIVALVAAFVIAYKRSQTLRNIIRATWGAIKKATVSVWNFLKGLTKAVWNSIKASVTGPVKVIKSVISTAWKVIKAVTKAVWSVIKSLIINPFRAAYQFLRSALSNMRSAVRGGFGAIRDIIKGIWDRIRDVVRAAVGRVVDLIRGIKSKVVGALSGAGHLLIGAGKAIIQGLLDGIDSLIHKVTDKLSWLTSKLPDWKGPKRKDKKLLFKPGQYIMQGLVSGIASQETALRRQLSSVSNTIGSTSMPSLGTGVSLDSAGNARVGGGNTYNLTVNALDPQAAGKAVVEAIKSYERTHGKGWQR